MGRAKRKEWITREYWFKREMEKKSKMENIKEVCESCGLEHSILPKDGETNETSR